MRHFRTKTIPSTAHLDSTHLYSKPPTAIPPHITKKRAYPIPQSPIPISKSPAQPHHHHPYHINQTILSIKHIRTLYSWQSRSQIHLHLRTSPPPLPLPAAAHKGRRSLRHAATADRVSATGRSTEASHQAYSSKSNSLEDLLITHTPYPSILHPLITALRKTCH